MKTLLVIAILFAIIFPATAQSDTNTTTKTNLVYNYSATEYSKADKSTGIQDIKKLPGQRMRDTGRTLTIVGGVALIAGVALMSTADALYYSSTTTNNGTVEEGDPKGGFGVVLTALGVGMTVTGIIFWSKGSKKYKRYQENQKQNLSLNMKGAGLSCVLKF